MKDMLTVLEMSKELNVTTRTIRNYIAEGVLKGVKIGGKWRFPKAELYKFIGNTNENLIHNFIEQNVFDQFAGILVINIPIINMEKLEKLKEEILNQYNNVYEGNGRKLFYQLVSQNNAQITIQGSHEYLMSFSNWIFKKIEKYKS